MLGSRPFVASQDGFADPCCRPRAMSANFPVGSLDDSVPSAVCWVSCLFWRRIPRSILNFCSNPRQIFLVPRAVLHVLSQHRRLILPNPAAVVRCLPWFRSGNDVRFFAFLLGWASDFFSSLQSA